MPGFMPGIHVFFSRRGQISRIAAAFAAESIGIEFSS